MVGAKALTVSITDIQRKKMRGWSSLDEERKEYLNGLADEYGLPKKFVFTMANLLGEDEDHDGLIVELEDAQSMFD